MNNEIKVLEEVMLNALPSLNTMYYDGWNLRFAEGYTNRANSVNIFGPSSLPLEEKIHYCERIYAKQNLPTVFKISPLSFELDSMLEQSGYELVTKTNVMLLDNNDISLDGFSSIVTEGINESWQNQYFKLNGTGKELIPIAKKVQGNILDSVLCATLSCESEIVACGLCIMEQDYTGLYDIIVSENHRNKGYGYDICTSLIRSASLHGAKKIYLQVVESNTNAVNLYKKIGFQRFYDYWYRVKIK